MHCPHSTPFQLSCPSSLPAHTNPTLTWMWVRPDEMRASKRSASLRSDSSERMEVGWGRGQEGGRREGGAHCSSGKRENNSLLTIIWKMMQSVGMTCASSHTPSPQPFPPNTHP